MKVQKRSRNGQPGAIVDFNGQSIVTAIESAMRETKGGIDHDLSSEIAEKIEKDFEDKKVVSVEEIQDQVESFLMKSARQDVAKKYIIYRENKLKAREAEPKGDTLLTEEFVSGYKHLANPMGQLGQFVYYRTYSRYLESEQRREYWWETVRRAVEYNCSLVRTSRKEAEELYDNIYHMRQFLSGRTLWAGNTPAAKEYPMSNYNCAFEIIDDFSAFEDLFYLLMLGSGVGLRILKEDVARMPKIRTDLEIIHKSYFPRAKSEREDNTSLHFTFNNRAKITVGDSKEGWMQALRYYVDIAYRREYQYIRSIIIDYDNVRPKGEKLKKFGGTASGYESLQIMFEKMDGVLKRAGARNVSSKVKLQPIDCLDIANIIGENVVSGGVRRSSEIMLIDEDDKDCIDAKNNLYQEINGKWFIDISIAHRQMSNNSIYYSHKPTREKIHWQIEKMRYSGEPAWINGEAMNRRSSVTRKGVNPCGEVLLDDKGMCNLTTINVLGFVRDGVLDIPSLLKAQRLSVRAGYRMTCVEMELHKWNEVLQRDKLLGCSLTGWQDMVNATGMTKAEQVQVLEQLRKTAHEEGKEYAHEIGQNEPILYTTVKPEGTLSQLPTVSSGVHFSHAPFYVRRVRISAMDPLVKVCEELEYPVFPEVGQEWETCKTKVVEFPVKAPSGRTKSDVSAIEQLEIYRMFMNHYVDHNCSITVHVRDNEWDDVEQWVWDNWDNQVGLTFLSFEDAFYQLMPYEAVSEEEFNERAAKMRPFIPSLISQYELDEEPDIGSADCHTGVCPVR
ncbi:ribonucleoside-triphosphate reductase, adenosylcobalamin-dependent [Parasporobacterium paucivorans]|uniref:Adenosylcobalamin-dependent ribonucleoside-triphosphate reductase n=1 Tax=Parasporobacterium paucivorans DSM 15970 TaxID=1122934 RepID=A0A1M6HM61_9FIRM|nr:ribonucleoside-triphosphate reductase, adenosylcobalamin-dependent [Parasporobacterium paucivorans]SHJ23257.1 ribonucleoside-diphosphate reductase alpha chain [Parasporobacterium paucivorans DSM 15970]